MDDRSVSWSITTGQSKPAIPDLAGIFFVALSILMLEIVLTRIFSVTMWYHFAFVSISLALLGGAAGGITVYVFPHWFPKERRRLQLGQLALSFSASIILSFLVHLGIPFIPRTSLSGFMNLATLYTVLAVPFFLGGLFLALALSWWSQHVSSVYFADLSGASIGCLLSVVALNAVGGPNAVIVVAILASMGAMTLSFSFPRSNLRRSAVALSIVLLLMLGSNVALRFIRIDFVKGELEQKERRASYEGWNALSQVIVSSPFSTRLPGGGISDNYQGQSPGYMTLRIDGKAATPIIAYSGDLEPFEFLKHDVTALAHHLRSDTSVLVIGPGGGRDILAGLVFNQQEIYGVEINPLIVWLVKERFNEYAGGVYHDPRVHIIVDEARSYITRSERTFGIIQASLIDTWAASAAGAYTLSENNLYTKEAFLIYFDHLDPDGILTMSRWYVPGNPGETLRLVSLALASWREAGISTPERHMMVVTKLNRQGEAGSVATLLLKKTSFSNSDIQMIHDIASRDGFQVLYTPQLSTDEDITALVAADDLAAFWREYALDISAPTDDRPFFFNMMKLSNFFHSGKTARTSGAYANMEAVSVIGGLSLVMLLLSLFSIAVPLWLRRGDWDDRHSPFLLYFACLGLGFITVEVPAVQRFILFLGHPVYALSVVLFSLLLFSALGSFLTRFVPPARALLLLRAVLFILCGLIALYALTLPRVFSAFIGLGLAARIVVSISLLLPLGLLMGVPFPLGITLLRIRAEPMIPWMYGVNGVTSVLGSVLAIALAITFGFSKATMIGVTSYLIALLSAFALTRKQLTPM